MADTFTTPNMQLVLPTPSVRIGPAYATDINNAIARVDGHDHSELNGVKVTPAGLDLSADVSFQSNNINAARSIRMTDQLTNLSGISDIASIYVTDGDLWYNNKAGAQVKVTSGGSLNTGAIVTNVWGTRAISANLTILGSDSFTNILVSSSSAINITLPAANAVSAGRYYVIQDVSGTSQTYNITITPVLSATINGASGAKTVSTQYGTWFIRSDGTSKWHLTYGSVPALSAAALTFGSAVFNSSGVTVGSVTLTSSALTIGSSSLQSTGLSTQALTASGNASIGGSLTGTSGHFTTNVVVDGNLTVTGTVNIDADAIGVSSITGGSITNCTISGGTADSVSITNGTISGATISGGNVGQASGLAEYDSSGRVALGNLPMALVDAQTAEITNSFDTTSGTAFSDVSNSTVTLSVNAGDLIVIDAALQIGFASGSGVGFARLVINDGGGDNYRGSVIASAISLGTANNTTGPITLLYTAQNSGTLTVRAQLRGAGGGSTFRLVGATPGFSTVTGASTVRALQYRP